MAYYRNNRAKKQYSVKEKEAHYNNILDNKDKAISKSKTAQLELNKTSFAAGYNQAVTDCRLAFKSDKKKK